MGHLHHTQLPLSPLYWLNGRTKKEEPLMTTLRPDPTFYPSPRTAMQAPPETLAYVVVLNPGSNGRPDALALLALNSVDSTYTPLVASVEMSNSRDETDNVRFNACSTA